MLSPRGILPHCTPFHAQSHVQAPAIVHQEPWQTKSNRCNCAAQCTGQYTRAQTRSVRCAAHAVWVVHEHTIISRQYGNCAGPQPNARASIRHTGRWEGDGAAHHCHTGRHAQHLTIHAMTHCQATASYYGMGHGRACQANNAADSTWLCTCWAGMPYAGSDRDALHHYHDRAAQSTPNTRSVEGGLLLTRLVRVCSITA